jgi:hypothetical protein
MMKAMEKRAPTRILSLLALLSGLCAGPVCWAADPASGSADQAAPWVASARVDWQTRELELTIDLDLAKAGLRLPTGRIEAAQIVERDLPALLKSLVLDLGVDSRRNVRDCLNDGSLEAGELLGLALDAKEGTAAFSRNLRSWHVEYSLPLEALSSAFIHQKRATTPEALLGYHPSRAFTGIVIYAKGSLPIHGEALEAPLSPCLFPRIFDEDMRLLLDRYGVDPVALASWGELGYASELDAAARDRVGDDPLRIDAKAFFGSLRTDLVIGSEEAGRILALAENRALLSAGRIVVLIDQPTRSLEADQR